MLSATRKHGLTRLAQRVPAALYWRYRHWIDHARWDRRWGTDTSGVEREYLVELPREDAAHAESGKGRALFFASVLGFRRIVGVEPAERLHRDAHRNRDRFAASSARPHGIELVHGDATTYGYPSGPLCIFMFNPFRGPVMDTVMERLSAHATETGASVTIGYVNPKCAPQVECLAGVTTVRVRAPIRGPLRRVNAFAVYRMAADAR